jgi:hypothetical protein
MASPTSLSKNDGTHLPIVCPNSPRLPAAFDVSDDQEDSDHHSKNAPIDPPSVIGHEAFWSESYVEALQDPDGARKNQQDSGC